MIRVARAAAKPRASPASLETLCVRASLRLLEVTCSRPDYLPRAHDQRLRGLVALSLPWTLRQRLLEELLIGGRLYNTVQLLVLEALLAPDIRRLAVRHVRRWYRARFLQLLESGRASGLRVLLMEDLTWLTGTPATSAPFAAAVRGLPQLRKVSLRYVCHDAILARLGACCPHLEEVDAGGSWGVTDRGLRGLCLRIGGEGGARGGVGRTLRAIFLRCFLEDALDERTALPAWWRAGVLRKARKNPCCMTLRIVRLSATTVTPRGVDLMCACAPYVTVLAS